MKKEIRLQLILVTLLFILMAGILIILSIIPKKQKEEINEINNSIIEEIKKDQEDLANKVILYSDPIKLNDNNEEYDYYLTTIYSNNEILIDYLIIIDTKTNKIIYCEEAR